MNDDKHMQGPGPAAKPSSRPPAGAPETVGTRYLRRLIAGLAEPLPLVLAEPANPDREAGG